jgi:hypothetical protein
MFFTYYSTNYTKFGTGLIPNSGRPLDLGPAAARLPLRPPTEELKLENADTVSVE